MRSGSATPSRTANTSTSVSYTHLSLRISDEAADIAKAYITETYGKEYLPGTRRVFKSKKNAQDAHEAIRPSDPTLTPEKVKKDLSAEQYKLCLLYTSHVRTPAELVERYRVQLELYRKVLGGALGMPVRECVLYSFALSREIII